LKSINTQFKMKVFYQPDKSQWSDLTKRPSDEHPERVYEEVKRVLEEVKEGGDRALISLTEKFDNVKITSLFVGKELIEQSEKLIDQDLKRAIDIAKSNIEKFHRAQLFNDIDIITSPGVRCLMRSVPIERVGLYIPGGTAPLFSTTLMLALPAMIAGCKEIILFTPPNRDGGISPEIAYSASITGIDTIVMVGGAHAIAAMAYGTESIKRVDKIFGPGNQYVTVAKQLISNIVSIDLVAGPSELMVIADNSCDPDFVAADLLSQAEHGVDSQVILVVDSVELANKVVDSLEIIQREIGREREVKGALLKSRVIILEKRELMIEFANTYAPEHLIISVNNPWEIADKIRAAGSIFIGNFSPESAGDYASGTNHTLPTGGWARSSSGVTLDSFMHRISYQEISREGIVELAPVIAKMAEGESLHGHKLAADIRVRKILCNNQKSNKNE
jgi:histidinol dehydrogenase